MVSQEEDGHETVRGQHVFRSWVAEKQHTEIFLVYFVLPKKTFGNTMICSRYCFLKNDFWVVILKMQQKMQ